MRLSSADATALSINGSECGRGRGDNGATAALIVAAATGAAAMHGDCRIDALAEDDEEEAKEAAKAAAAAEAADDGSGAAAICDARCMSLCTPMVFSMISSSNCTT